MSRAMQGFSRSPKHRGVLLSIRERPLPVLWLLAFLAPYLLFSATAVSHFHGSDYLSSHSTSQRVAGTAFDASAHAQTPHPIEEKSCLLCDWSMGSSGIQSTATHHYSVETRSAEYSALTLVAASPVTSSPGARAPPASI